MFLLNQLRSRLQSAAEMPPALSDEEASDAGSQPAVPWARSESADDEELLGGGVNLARNGANTKADDEADDEDQDEGPDENGDEDEGDLDEDEFIVEAIKKHMVDEDGSLKFLVKWEGWEKKSDMTWEPEDNLMESASEILKEYYKRIGGRDSIFEESEKAARGKKRGRESSGAVAAAATKRSRKVGLHPAETSPPATAKKWSPPAGSWEDDIESIDACEDGGGGRLVVFLIWKNGRKTKHDTSVVYKKCPQKMLQFYERHVRIIRDENRAAVE